jgi:putative SOS response-associated peptidase YedK
MSFAGLWDVWRDPSTGEVVYSCVIITTEANAVLSPIHDRMPVILTNDAMTAWLDPSFADVVALQRMLRPTTEDLRARPVSRVVNDPRNDGPELLRAD